MLPDAGAVAARAWAYRLLYEWRIHDAQDYADALDQGLDDVEAAWPIAMDAAVRLFIEPDWQVVATMPGAVKSAAGVRAALETWADLPETIWEAALHALGLRAVLAAAPGAADTPYLAPDRWEAVEAERAYWKAHDVAMTRTRLIRAHRRGAENAHRHAVRLGLAGQDDPVLNEVSATAEDAVREVVDLALGIGAPS